MIYLELFLAFAQISLFSIGGGYAAMPLIMHQAVEVHNWITFEAFSDIITISEMTPGPIAINSATFVGIQVSGIPGALAATLGVITPSSIIVSLLAFLYYRYKGLKAVESILKSLRPAVVAMIASAAVSLITMATITTDGSFNLVGFIIMAISFLALRIFKASPILVIALSGVMGLVAGLIF